MNTNVINLIIAKLAEGKLKTPDGGPSGILDSLTSSRLERVGPSQRRHPDDEVAGSA